MLCTAKPHQRPSVGHGRVTVGGVRRSSVSRAPRAAARASASTPSRRRPTAFASDRPVRRSAAHSSERSKSSGRMAGSPVGSTAVTRSTSNVWRPASVAANRYHVAPFAARPSGCTVRRVTAPSRATYCSTTCSSSTVAACSASRCDGGRRRPGRSQSEGSTITCADAAVARTWSGSGSAREQLAQRRLDLRRRRARASQREERPHLRGAQAAEIGAASAREAPPAAAHRARRTPGRRPCRAHRGSRPCGALRDLELGRDLGCGDLTLRLQHEEDGHQAVGAHPLIVPSNRSAGDRFGRAGWSS